MNKLQNMQLSIDACIPELNQEVDLDMFITFSCIMMHSNRWRVIYMLVTVCYVLLDR